MKLINFPLFKLYQCEIKLQTKIQITQQHNKSKLKIRNKRNNCQEQNINLTLKEDCQKNKLKHLSKFTSKTLIY